MPPFLRELFHYEAPAEMPPGFASAHAAIEPEPQPAEPAWTGPSQEEWSDVMGYIQAQQQQEIAAQQEAQRAAQPDFDPQYAALTDPFNDNFGPTLAQKLQAIEERVSAYDAYQQQQQYGEAEERALDILDSVVSNEGELLQKDQAYPQILARAGTFMDEETRRHGFGPKAAEAAITRAYKEQKAYEQAVIEAGVNQHMNQLTNLGNATREPGATSIGAQTFTTTPGGDEMGVVRKYGGMPM